jgi:hypothetical protein
VEFIGMGWLREFGRSACPSSGGARGPTSTWRSETLWQDEVSTFRGELYDLPPCRMYPKPVQRPHPPIHVGGESDAALRRVARHAQGWFSFNRPPADLPEGLGRLEAALAVEPQLRRRDGDGLLLPDSDPSRPRGLPGRRRHRLVLLCLAFDQDLLRTQLDDLVRDVLDPVRG